MTLEFWNTIAAWGTFAVIAATAIAAVVQLKHLRHSNQLGGLLTTFGILQDPALRDLINYVRHDLQDKMNDEACRRSLLDTPVDRAKHPEFYIIDVYNHIGAFLRGGLIDEDIYMRTEWYNVRLYWNLLGKQSRFDAPSTLTFSKTSSIWPRAQIHGSPLIRAATIQGAHGAWNYLACQEPQYRPRRSLSWADMHAELAISLKIA